jgi:hypothetical protein
VSRPPSLWGQLSPEQRAYLFVAHTLTLTVVTWAFVWAASTRYPLAFALGGFVVCALSLLAALLNFARSWRSR